MLNWKLIFLFTCIIFLLACHRPAAAPQLPPPAAIQLHLPDDTNDKIIFLTYKITLKDSVSESYDFVLTNKSIANGTLKKKFYTNAANIEKDYLYCELAADKNGLGQYERVDNPLLMHYEYSKENGTLAQASVRQHTGDLVFRFQFHPSMKYLLIYKPVAGYQHLKLLYRASILP